FPSEAAFSTSVFAVGLATALLLFGAILRMAYLANRQGWRRAAEARPSPTLPAHDLETALRELVRDLRPSDIASREARTLASTARYDLPRRSYLRVMNVGNAPVMGAHEFPRRRSGSAQPVVPLRSAV